MADARQKGVVALNPTSAEWMPQEPAGPGWGEFSEVPISASLVRDVDSDGTSELLIGYKDGFVRLCRLADGELLGRLCAGAPVTGLAALRHRLVVATRTGLRLYNAALREQGAANFRATGIVSLDGPQPVVCAADDTGAITAFGL